jgi:hypothetical protein
MPTHATLSLLRPSPLHHAFGWVSTSIYSLRQLFSLCPLWSLIPWPPIPTRWDQIPKSKQIDHDEPESTMTFTAPVNGLDLGPTPDCSGNANNLMVGWL